MASSTTAVLSRVAVCAAIPTDRASAWSVLRPCPVDSSRTRRASFAGTSITSMPSAASREVSAAPRPVAPSTAQAARGQRRGEAAQLPVAVAVDLDADRGEGLQAVVDRDGGPGRLVGIDRDDDRGRCRTGRAEGTGSPCGTGNRGSGEEGRPTSG